MASLEPSPFKPLSLAFRALLSSFSANPTCPAYVTLPVRTASLCVLLSTSADPLFITNSKSPTSYSMARTFSILYSLQIFHDPSRIKKLFFSILNNSWYLAAQNLILCMLGFLSPPESMGTLYVQSEPFPHRLLRGDTSHLSPRQEMSGGPEG